MSAKQEVAVRFSNSIHIPPKCSPPNRTHSLSRLRQSSKLGGDNSRSSEYAVFESRMREKFPPSQRFFDVGEEPKVTWSQAGNLNVFAPF